MPTPGTDQERHLAGSMHRRAGPMFVAAAAPKRGRGSSLSLKHPDDLRRRRRRYQRVHIIGDHAGFHTSPAGIQYLRKWGDRIQVHRLPGYSPDYNPLERVRWHLREAIGRDHRCRDPGALLDRVLAWLEPEDPSRIEGSVDPKAKAA